MGKIVYKRYQIYLHKKCYEVLVPYQMPQKVWLDPRGYLYKHADCSELFVDINAMKCIRNAFITLAQEPDKIIYFPLENRCSIHERVLIDKVPQVVFYNHTIQFKRKEWKAILEAIRYTRSTEYVVYYKFLDLKLLYEKMLHQWKKRKSYYRDGLVKEYYEKNTVFFECDKRNDLQVAVELGKQLEDDLEYEARRGGYEIPVWIGPHTNTWQLLSFYYVTERFEKDYLE